MPEKNRLDGGVLPIEPFAPRRTVALRKPSPTRTGAVYAVPCPCYKCVLPSSYALPETSASSFGPARPVEAWRGGRKTISVACSGRSPMWRLLDLRRDESSLRVAVRWMVPMTKVRSRSSRSRSSRWRYIGTTSTLDGSPQSTLPTHQARKSAEASTTLGSRRNRTKQRPSR